MSERPPHQRAARGITLIELMVAIAVLAVLLAIGMPSFAALVRQWRQDSAVDAFIGDVRLARSTATRTSRPVVVCAIGSAGRCSTGADWAGGWLVFSDLDGNGERDAGEPVIAQRGAQAGIAAMRDKNSSAQLSFRSNGTLSGTSDTVSVQPQGASGPTQVITINMLGRARVGTPEAKP